MAGHSHWARIKHKKGVLDARRGRLWSKLARNV
ncbi:MAG: YebC/PmpR family DNA-binding transcriptional regulator, partial [Phycisphaerae bacterium]